MTKYAEVQRNLKESPRRWLVTGCAGFIGSNLLETLLKFDQTVVGLDNFSTGKQVNLDEVESLVTPEQWSRFRFIKGDICDLDTCREAVGGGSVGSTSEAGASETGEPTHGRTNAPLFPTSLQLKPSTSTAAAALDAPTNHRTDEPPPSPDAPTNRRTDAPPNAAVDYVLHQAALGSVPRSIEDPIRTNASNITGFLNMLVAARDAGVKRFVYAASSSTYGDHPGLPKVEDVIGKPLSPYAVTKYVNELYADVFGRCYGVASIGLRYFNVFGPRQDPEGAYAAVIPKWIAAMLQNEPVFINGDGETSRDFCYVANVIQANLLAATTENPEAINQVYNVAVGERTTLNELFALLKLKLPTSTVFPTYRPPRAGDVRHSQADVSKAARLLGYDPTHGIGEGLNEAFHWYVKDARASRR